MLLINSSNGDGESVNVSYIYHKEHESAKSLLIQKSKFLPILSGSHTPHKLRLLPGPLCIYDNNLSKIKLLILESL